jgi:protein TonB
MNEKILRPVIFIFAAVLHLVALFFIVFETEQQKEDALEHARIMKVTDLDELPPPEPEQIPQVEAIAETMIETDTPPVQEVVAAGTIITPITVAEPEEEYLPMHRVSNPPQFDANAIKNEIIYPPIALRSGIEGRVILELFVDRTGTVRDIKILQENPEGRGFGEAAIKVFSGRKGKPALANGEPVSARYRWPVTFTIK